jgi:putative ABC transport system permease protein
LKSLLYVVRADLGADTAGVVTFDFHLSMRDTVIPLPGTAPYRGMTLIEINEKPALTVERLLDRIQEMPGVTGVAAASNPPLGGFVVPIPFLIEGAQPPSPSPSQEPAVGAPTATYAAVAGDYFDVMRIPLREGRVFEENDTVDRAPVVIINESLARRYFQNESPLGRRIRFDVVPNEVYREVVGVVADTAIGPLERDRTPAIYLPHLQQSKVWLVPRRGPRSGMYFAVRTTEGFGTFAPALTAAVAEVDANTPVAELRPLRDTLSGQMQDLRLVVLLVGAFAIVAAVLAATGVYGAISLAVADRTREIAIRMVVGARALQIAKMVLRNVLWFVSLGLAVGLVLAIGLSRALAWALFGIGPTDPSTYALVTLAFVVIAVVACLLPALRAVNVNPTVALKAE